MGIITSLFTIVGYFYMIETEGLEKSDIYYILRGQKTREQCLKERRENKYKGSDRNIPVPIEIVPEPEKSVSMEVEDIPEEPVDRPLSKSGTKFVKILNGDHNGIVETDG